jgi:uncharacterized protein
MNKALAHPYRRYAIIILIAAVVIFAALRLFYHPVPKTVEDDSVPFVSEGSLQFVQPGGAVISNLEIEIADDEAQRTTGLMYRNGMEPNRGMLFIFDDNQPRSFWMRNTRFPLDMIFVGADSTVVTVRSHTVPLTDDGVGSDAPAKFVVEVNAGYAARLGIYPGARIRYQRSAQ